MRWYEGMHKTLYPSPASSNSYIVVIGIAMVTGLVPSRPRPDAVVGSVIRQWRWLRAATMRTGARLVAVRCLQLIHRSELPLASANFRHSRRCDGLAVCRQHAVMQSKAARVADSNGAHGQPIKSHIMLEPCTTAPLSC
jgi:hypothetical protein